jgi:hypothetical protein
MGEQASFFSPASHRAAGIADWLSVNVAANFGAQLPELLRGVYYEHWRPIATPVKERHKADFIARVDKAFKADPMSSLPRRLRLYSNFCPKNSPRAKSSTYAMSCPPSSERFGHFPRRLMVSVSRHDLSKKLANPLQSGLSSGVDDT